MKKIFIYFIALLLLTSGTFSVHAQTPSDTPSKDTYTLLAPLPCIQGTGNNCTDGNTISNINLNTYLGYIFKFGIAIAAFLAVVVIIWEGFQYMLSEIPSMKSDAKNRITGAILGLLGVLASYLILATIDPRLVEINTTLPAVNIKSDSAKNAQDKLNEDFAGLNSTDRARDLDLTNQIQKKDEAIAPLNDKKTAGDYMTDEENTKLDTLKAEVNKLKQERDKVIANEAIDNAFASTLDRINKLDYKSSADSLNEAIAGDKIIEDLSNTYIKKMEALQDFEGAQKLATKGLFYKSQLEEQAKLVFAIADNNKTELATDLVVYQNKLATISTPIDTTSTDPSQVTRNPDIEAAEKIILQNRINLINETLSKK